LFCIKCFNTAKVIQQDNVYVHIFIVSNHKTKIQASALVTTGSGMCTYSLYCFC